MKTPFPTLILLISLFLLGSYNNLCSQIDSSGCYILPEVSIRTNYCNFDPFYSGKIQINPACVNTIFYDFSDTVFVNPDESCSKVLRIWDILDWNKGSKFKHIQIIKFDSTYNHICKQNVALPYLASDSLIIKSNSFVHNPDVNETYSFSIDETDTLMVLGSTSFYTQLNIFRSSDQTHCISNIAMLPFTNLDVLFLKSLAVTASDILPTRYDAQIFVNPNNGAGLDFGLNLKIKKLNEEFDDSLTIYPTEVGTLVDFEIKYEDNFIKILDTVTLDVKSCNDRKDQWINYLGILDLDGSYEKVVPLETFFRNNSLINCHQGYDSILIKIANHPYEVMPIINSLQLSRHLPVSLQFWYDNVTTYINGLYLVVQDSSHPTSKSFFAYDIPLVKNVPSMVSLHTEDLIGATSLQFGFIKKECDLTGIGYGALNDKALFFNLQEPDIAKFIWTDIEAPLNSLTQYDTLITFIITPFKDGKLSDFISIDSGYSGFGYNEVEVDLDLDFNFRAYKPSSTNNVNELHITISPNPTSNNSVEIISSSTIDAVSIYKIDGAMVSSVLEQKTTEKFRVSWTNAPTQEILMLKIQIGDKVVFKPVINW